MAVVVAIDAARPVRLETGWALARSAPGAWARPRDIPSDAEWIAATVPGTAAAALREAGLCDDTNIPSLDTCDVWFATTIAGAGAERLHFAGLATWAEIYLDDDLVLTSHNMFHAHDVPVHLDGEHRLRICCRALATALEVKGKRARWRTRVAAPQNLRFVRTSLLGHMPGWCPPVTPVGPWRAVERGPATPAIRAVDLRVRLDGDAGVVEITVEPGLVAASPPQLACGGGRVALTPAADGLWRGTLRLPEVARWWPHTHGDPVLYDVTLAIAGQNASLGRVGFREIAIDRGEDGRGFALRINGVPVFCRGACWTSADLVGLRDAAEIYGPLLERMCDAGMNMVRVGGTGVYEGDAFYRLCDERGLLVWQDFMFASFDYPVEDPAFVASATEEARQFLDRTQVSPCLAVLCGASEVGLQAAMFGLPPETWSNALFDVELAGCAAAARPDVPYVAQTPSGGDLPFVVDAGTSHYYGVSAYKRPLDDARRADVRFATECLCFANVPDGVPVALEPGRAETVHPVCAPRVAGDTNASWFFEDVRNHYLALLHGVDPLALRNEDPARFLDLSRAVGGEVMEAVFADWRRVGSATAGGLVWFLRDLWPGAGWGVVDSSGVPKAAYHGLKRAFRPQTVLLTDEGLNGLRVHVLNERPTAFAGTLTLTCLGEGRTPVMRAERAVALPPRGALTHAATELWGGFFDTTYSYRFGPPAHDVTVARLTDADGRFVADAFHFPLGRDATVHDIGLSARLDRRDGAWCLDVAAERLAQSVHVRDANYDADEHWCHLAPGHPRTIRLVPRQPDAPTPTGIVAAVNGAATRY